MTSDFSPASPIDFAAVAVAFGFSESNAIEILRAASMVRGASPLQTEAVFDRLALSPFAAWRRRYVISVLGWEVPDALRVGWQSAWGVSPEGDKRAFYPPTLAPASAWRFRDAQGAWLSPFPISIPLLGIILGRASQEGKESSQ